jgi:hypothetical protein
LWSFDKISPIYSKKEYKKIYMFNKDNTFKEFNSQNDAARFLIKSKDKEINRKNIIIMSSNIRQAMRKNCACCNYYFSHDKNFKIKIKNEYI